MSIDIEQLARDTNRSMTGEFYPDTQRIHAALLAVQREAKAEQLELSAKYLRMSVEALSPTGLLKKHTVSLAERFEIDAAALRRTIPTPCPT